MLGAHPAVNRTLRNKAAQRRLLQLQGLPQKASTALVF